MKFIAKTLYGLEPVLEKELSALGASNITRANRAVTFTGDKSLLYRVNYCCRTAMSVLTTLSEFRIWSKDDLYARSKRIDWRRFMDADDTFCVVPVVNSKLFSHTGYPGLILKDAIVDHFRDLTGRRPSVDTVSPSVMINLHISNESVTISLDSSVVPLFKRGYRQEQAAAPLNEVLAAGILYMSEWDYSVPLLDPMCGSGTIPIEAGLMASGTPPGKFRSFFGFQKWKDYDGELFNGIKKEADSAISFEGLKIHASDISSDAVEKARKNAGLAGLDKLITFEVSDFCDVRKSEDKMLLVMNPPYGERIKPEEILSLYGMIGSTLKRYFAGSAALVISSHREALKQVGLKPAGKHILFNGALECLLLRYEMYEGSRKMKNS